MKQEKGKDIMVMGGGELAASLFEAGVIDEVGFNIHPTVLGNGIPAFKKNVATDRSGIDRMQSYEKWVCVCLLQG